MFTLYRPMVPQGKEWRIKTRDQTEMVKPVEEAVKQVEKAVKMGDGLVSDGEIWTAHGGVNPCGLFVQWGGV
jgi:hypothetical protein